MANEETETENSAAISGDIYLYKSTEPVCDPNDAPLDHSTLTVEWQQTLVSFTGTMSCTQGYSLIGSSDITCDDKGIVINRGGRLNRTTGNKVKPGNEDLWK